jgi:hypothetical protein
LLKTFQTLSNGQLISSISGFYQKISDDWQFIVIYDREDKQTKICRITDGQLICSANGICKQISNDWQFITTYDQENNQIKIWRITDGQLICSANGICKQISNDWQFIITYDQENNQTNIWRISDGRLIYSINGFFRQVSYDWDFISTSQDNNNYNISISKVPDESILDFYLHKSLDQISIEILNIFKNMKQQNNKYVYPKINELERAWIDLIITLAEYNLSFDLDIAEELPVLEASEFDIDIDG